MAAAKFKSQDDNLDNVSDKYMTLEESVEPEGIKDGRNSGAKVKHQIVGVGVEYALPEKDTTELNDDYSQLESVKYISFDDKGNAISGDIQISKNPKATILCATAYKIKQMQVRLIILTTL